LQIGLYLLLDGQIRRGTGEEISAVLWSSDLRGFTERSDRLPGQRMIALLNAPVRCAGQGHS
jgi:adenylate cyclase